MADPQAQLDLRRRARRRLIGAIALVLALVIVPPWIMDLEPKPPATKLRVEIPAQDSGRLKPPPPPPKPAAPDAAATKPGETAKPVETTKPVDTAKPAAAKPTEPPPARSVDARTVAALGGSRPAEQAASAGVPAPDEKSKPADDKPKAADDRQTSAKPPEPRRSEETARAEAALSATGAYVVTLGTFGQAENVKQLQARLAKEGIKSYTEPVKTAKGEQTRVRAGPFENRDAAEQARERLKGMGIDVGNVALRQ